MTLAVVAEQGYRGTAHTVRLYLKPIRSSTFSAAPAPRRRAAGPMVREVTGWIMRRSDTLTRREPPSSNGSGPQALGLRRTTELVAAFADMMRGLRGDRLKTWLQTIETAENLPHLRSFTVGLGATKTRSPTV